MKEQGGDYVPALGWRALTPFYDSTIRILTRERTWRTALVTQIDPQPGQTIVDVGCGTGSLAIILKQAQPHANIIGLDPDPEILARAASKARAAGVEIEWREGFARDVGSLLGGVDKAVSSLVFHQVPMAEKEAGLRAMADSIRQGGEVHIADFARQRSRAMRIMFSVVGWVDGRENTTPNARGALEDILGSISPAAAVPARSFRTILGEISLFKLKIGAR